MPHEFFLINDIAKSSSKQAISLEHASIIIVSLVSCFALIAQIR
jgi:hypothetical protein